MSESRASRSKHWGVQRKVPGCKPTARDRGTARRLGGEIFAYTPRG
jgi:hypothetical protein